MSSSPRNQVPYLHYICMWQNLVAKPCRHLCCFSYLPSRHLLVMFCWSNVPLQDLRFLNDHHVFYHNAACMLKFVPGLCTYLASQGTHSCIHAHLHTHSEDHKLSGMHPLGVPRSAAHGQARHDSAVDVIILPEHTTQRCVNTRSRSLSCRREAALLAQRRCGKARRHAGNNRHAPRLASA